MKFLLCLIVLCLAVLTSRLPSRLSDGISSDNLKGDFYCHCSKPQRCGLSFLQGTHSSKPQDIGSSLPQSTQSQRPFQSEILFFSPLSVWDMEAMETKVPILKCSLQVNSFSKERLESMRDFTFTVTQTLAALKLSVTCSSLPTVEH